MRTVHVRQGSPEWRAWRALGVGASDTPAIVGVSPWRTREETLVEKARCLRGWELPDRSNWAMARGHRLEPQARREYEALFGWEAPPMCAESEEYPWLRASCDGFVTDRRVVVEIKCPNRDDHALALERQVPFKYHPQVHHQLLVMEASVAHYVSYTDSSYFSATQRLAVVTVVRPRTLDHVLLSELCAFWAEVVQASQDLSPSS